MSDGTTEHVSDLLALAERIERSQRLLRFVANEQAVNAKEIATEAADCLFDIRHSAERLRTELLPKLFTQEPESDEFNDTLEDIAEEFRHIHYHLVNTRLFSYILPTS